jgi:hypothetical protein
MHQALSERDRVPAANATGWCARCAMYAVNNRAVVEMAWSAITRPDTGQQFPPMALRLCAQCADGYERMHKAHMIPHPTSIRRL